MVSYLLFNTPLISDEFRYMVVLKQTELLSILSPANTPFLSNPVEHYTHYIWYYFVEIDDLFLINLLKIIYSLLSLYMISKFFCIYLDRQNALFASFLFVFFPTHDSTVFVFMGLYLTLSFSFYLYSYYLAHNNKLKSAFMLALIGSFISYGSSPIAISLFILFLLNKDLKKGTLILVPNVIYIFYYIIVSEIMRLGTPRIIEDIDKYALIKQFILQVLTFIDSVFGPSMWLKIYYSLTQLSVISLLIGFLFVAVFYKSYSGVKEKCNTKLLTCLLVMLLLSFGIFAITGRYPQLAFNLGNRTTIFGSLLLAYIIVVIPISKTVKIALFALMTFSILGISDHWKNWNIHQQHVIDNIKNNQALRDYKDDKHIFVSGNQYSKYGPISHIEFFSESWVVGAVFDLALKEKISAVTINKRHVYEDGYLIDTKNNSKAEVNDYINVYDSENDRLFTLNVEEINSYIDSLTPENRHWIQLLSKDNYLRKIVLFLMPRLKYAF